MMRVERASSDASLLLFRTKRTRCGSKLGIESLSSHDALAQRDVRVELQRDDDDAFT